MIIKAILCLLFVLLPLPAFALDMEFYTYGGFDAIVSAFQKVALISSDGNYRALFYTVTAFGVIFAAISMARKDDDWGNVTKFLIGLVVYLGLLVPTGSIWVYDQVKNRNQQVAGVPDLIVAISGTLNLIERGIIDIVSTTGDPIGYQESAGGIGPKMLYEAATANLVAETYTELTLQSYINECVVFEMFRPGSGIDLDKMNSNSTDFLTDVLEPANSPAIFTTLYSSANPEGTVTTCQDAWDNNLKTYLSAPANYNNMLDQVCQSGGYDPNNPTEMAQCKGVTLPAWVNQASGQTVTSDVFIRQNYIAYKIAESLAKGDPNPTANVSFGSQAQGSYEYSSEWIPYMKAVMTAQSLAFAPFLFLFLPTQMWRKVTMFVVGLLLYPTIWGIADAVLHQFAIDYSYKVYKSVQTNKLGMDAIAFLTDDSMKILNMWWYTRMSGMAIAGVITGLFVEFGHAATAFSGHMEKGAHGAGDRGGEAAFTPKGTSDAINSSIGAVTTLANVPRYGFNGMAKSSQLDSQSHIAGNMGALGYYGGNVNQASKAIGAGQALQTTTAAEAAGKKIQEMGGFDKATAMFSDYHAKGDISKAKETAHQLSAFKGMENLTDQEAMANALKMTEGTINANTHYQELAKSRGVTPMQAAMDEGEFMGIKSGAEMAAFMEPGAKSMLASKIGGGVTGADIDQYKGLLNNHSMDKDNSGFRTAIEGNEKLQAIDNFMTEGNGNAPNLMRTYNYGNAMKDARFDLAKQMGGYSGDTKVGGHQQLLNKLDSWGLGRSDYGVQQLAKAESSSQLNETMAKAANDYYSKQVGRPVDYFKSGTKMMDVAHAIGPDGMFNITNAEKTEGGFTEKWDNGGITREGTLTAKQALEKAASMETEGHGYAAQGLRNLVSAKDGGTAAPGTGITDNEAIQFREILSQDGKDATFHAKHETETEWTNLETRNSGSDKQHIQRDTHTVDTGQRITKGNKIWTGRSEVHEDTKKDVTDRGPELKNAMFMAQYGDSAYAKYLTSAKSPKEFDANLAMTVDSTLNDVRDFVTKKGLSAGFAEGTAGVSGGFKLFGIGADAKGTVGRASREEQAYDLMRSDLMRELRSARIEAAKTGLSDEATNKYITDKAGDFLHKNIFEPAEKAKPGQFGGDAPISALKGDGGRSHMEVTDEMVRKNPNLSKLK